MGLVGPLSPDDQANTNGRAFRQPADIQRLTGCPASLDRAEPSLTPRWMGAFVVGFLA